MTPEPAALQARLRALFLDELEDNLVVLNKGLLQLEERAGQGLPADVVRDLFRAAHSVKGAAHSAAVSAVVAVCDRLEETFAALRDGALDLDAATVAALFADVDRLTAEGRQLRAGPAPAPTEPGGGVAATAPVVGDPSVPDPGPGTTLAVAQGGRGSGLVRLPGPKLDALVDQAGELRASSTRLDLLMRDAAGCRERVAAHQRRWRKATAGLRDALAAGDGDVVDAALAAGDEAWADATAEIDGLVRAVMAAEHGLRQVTATLADAAQGLRLQPFGQVCEGLDRVVRDLAAGAGKQARLVVEGADIEIDRAVAGVLREPLLHLLRNAVDHGIETPDARTRAGKPPAGSIRLAVALRDGGVGVSVADDGAGIDIATLRVAADRQGRAAGADDAELVFLPGLSTAPVVSDVSGRGMGLDAVRARVERLGGTVQVDTAAGHGTCVTLLAPLTLSTFRAVLVSSAGETLALPLAAVRRLVTVTGGDLRQAQGQTFVVLDGEAVPVVAVGQVLGFAEPEPLPPDRRLPAALVASGATSALLVVDQLVGEGEIVMKPLPERVAGAPAVLGATILASGRVVLVLNPAACVRLGMAQAPPTVAPAPERRARRILVAEDTLTTRVLERSILEAAGYEVTVAVDGADAWRLLQERGADLVVSDVDMPRMDGFALCQAIRASGRFRDLPVVLVTSLAGDRDRGRGIEVGASAYIVKSAFEQGALLETIGRLL